MLTSIDLYSPEKGLLSLPLADISNGYSVRSIEGLDPVKAEIVSSPIALIDGSQYQSSRRENRNLILTFGIESDYVSTTVAQLRQVLYKYLMPKSSITIRFHVDFAHFADISGRVESFETPLFSSSPEIKVSIICFKPDFVSPNTVLINGNTVADSTVMDIEYAGTVDAGIEFNLLVNRALSEFTIYSQLPGGPYRSLDFIGLLQDLDVVKIVTTPGEKKVTLTRGGLETSVLYNVSPASTWISLSPGTNQFRVQTSGDPIPYTVQYKESYGGL